MKNGTIEFRTANVNWGKDGYKAIGYKETCDLFLVYCPETNRVYKIKTDECPNYNGRLRIDNTKSNRTIDIKWAKDYELHALV